MRFRLVWSRPSLFTGLFLAALILSFPLRLAIGWLDFDRLGLAARDVRGSIWRGTLTEAHVANLAIGDLQARLDPLPLFIGRVRVDFASEGGGDELRGAASVGAHSVGVDDVSVRLPLGSAFAPLPLLALDLSDVSAYFRDGLCYSAEGRAKAEMDGGLFSLPLVGGLSGNVRCDNGALLLPLVSQSAGETMMLRLSRGGRYRAEFVVRRGSDTVGRDRLLAAGFAPQGDALTLSVDGVF